jgi:thymidylate synthase
MYFKGIVTELIWFLRGDTNIKYLVDNDVHIWTGDAYKKYTDHFIGYEDVPNQDWFVEQIKTDIEFANRWGDLGSVYGKQWRKWKTFRKVTTNTPSKPTDSVDYIDQIANLINDLKTNPDSRRLMVSAWNVGELDQMVLPPCHFSFQCYSHESNGKRYLSLAWNQRSVDVGLGLPFNIASYGLLLEIIAKEVGMIPYELIGNLGDCHIYNNHVNGLKEQLTREPHLLPKLLCLDEYHYLTDEELVGKILFTEKIKKFRPDFFKVGDY